MPKIINTTCGYCAVGCNLAVEINDDGSYKIRGRKGYPVNDGMLCPKGTTIDAPMKAPDRTTSAYIRKNGEMKPAGFDEAVETFVSKLKSVRGKYGEDSCAFYSTGQLTMEDFALLGLVGRIGMGMEGDGNTRFCMASAAVAYKKTFGFDAPPFSYEDIDHSDCLIFVGANPAVSHPIVWQRYKKNKQSEDHDLIVIDPRKTDVGKAAHTYIPVQPKGDLPLLYTLANILIENDWIDRDYIRDHVDNFEGFKAFVSDFPLKDSVKNCGVEPELIESTARTIHKRNNVSFWWTMGVNQSYEGTMTACAIIALSLITGNIGRKGTGPNSITGQCNAMGSRINSFTTSMYGGRDFTNETHRKDIAEMLSIDEKRIPARPTIPFNVMVERIQEGKIKFLWIIATNPIQSFVATNNLKKIFQNLDTLVVQDLYVDTPTAKYADIFLPAAASPEKEGTFINMERRIGTVQAFLKPPEGTYPDYEIFKKLAVAYGCGDLLKGWETPDEAFEQLKQLSKGQPCDFSGIPNRRFVDEKGGVQWPFPEGTKAVPYRRLFEDGKFFTPNGKAQLVFQAPAEKVLPTEKHPFILLTGRATQAQFHTSTRTGRVEKLKNMYSPVVFVELNPEDMNEINVKEGENVRVSSPIDSMEALVKCNPGLQRKQVFIPMHYVTSNCLIAPSFDEYSKQPSFKYSIVRVDSA